MDSSTHDRARQDWLDLKQVERDFPISRRTVWNWIAVGKLAAYRPFRKVLIKREDLVKLLEATRIGQDLDRVVSETIAELRGRK